MATRSALLFGLGLLALVLAQPVAAREIDLDRHAFDTATHRVGDVRAARCAPVAPPVRRAPARGKDWRFFVAPYGWLASVEGTIVSGGESTDLDVPFSDLVEVTNGGFQLYLEARWRRFFVAFDGTWAHLTPVAERVGDLVDVQVDIDQQLFDCRVGYEVYRKSLDGCLDPCCEGLRRWIVADVFVGARYWYTKQTLSIAGRGPIGIEAEFEDTDERWDPFVGARFGIDLTRHWGLAIRGDIGGFGIGDAAQLAWQVSGGVTYGITEWMHVFLGYRALAFDTVQGSGADRNGADLVQHGPLLGLGFSF